MVRKALLRIARDLADSGFKGVVRAYYARENVSVLSVEFIIYRRPNGVRRFWARAKRALGAIPSIIVAFLIGAFLALILRLVV